MPDKLVTVASFTNVAEAEVARMVLLGQGIDARTTNVAFVSWFWHYSNATYGVGVLVRDADAESAWTILNQPPEVELSAADSPTCAVCSEPLHPGWQICWQCGATVDGEIGEVVSKDPSHLPGGLDPVGEIVLFGLAGPLLAVLFLGAPVLLAAVVLAIIAFWGCRYFDSFWPDRPERDLGPQQGDDLYELGAGLAEDIAARAWRASVFAAMWFPPLIYYSMYVLYRLSNSGLPLTRRARSRRDWAWWANLVCFIPCSIVIVMFLVMLVFTLGDFLWSLVSAARGLLAGSDQPW